MGQQVGTPKGVLEAGEIIVAELRYRIALPSDYIHAFKLDHARFWKIKVPRPQDPDGVGREGYRRADLVGKLGAFEDSDGMAGAAESDGAGEAADATAGDDNVERGIVHAVIILRIR